MLLALGVGSQIGTLEGVISTVFDIQIVRGARKEVVSGKYTFILLINCYIDLVFDLLLLLLSCISRRVHRQLPDRPAVRDRLGRVLGQDFRLVRRNHRIDLYRPPRVRRRHVHLRAPKVRNRDNLPIGPLGMT